jgi:hypothetical protein
VKTRILSPAEEDLKGGYRFYDSQSPGLGSDEKETDGGLM